jgi:hypothetical protein
LPFDLNHSSKGLKVIIDQLVVEVTFLESHPAKPSTLQLRVLRLITWVIDYLTVSDFPKS